MEEVPKVYPKAGSVYASYLPDDWNPLAQWDADNQYQAEGDEEEPQGVFIEDGGHGKHYPGPGGKVIAWVRAPQRDTFYLFIHICASFLFHFILFFPFPVRNAVRIDSARQGERGHDRGHRVGLGT